MGGKKGPGMGHPELGVAVVFRAKMVVKRCHILVGCVKRVTTPWDFPLKNGGGGRIYFIPLPRRTDE